MVISGGDRVATRRLTGTCETESKDVMEALFGPSSCSCEGVVCRDAYSQLQLVVWAEKMRRKCCSQCNTLPQKWRRARFGCLTGTALPPTPTTNHTNSASREQDLSLPARHLRMVSAADNDPDAGEDPPFDPLSAFAASSSYTSSQRSSRPGTSLDHQPRTSGIEASAGSHYFDLKALQSSLQVKDAAATSTLPRVTSSITDGSAEREGNDDEDDGGKTPGERRTQVSSGPSEARYESDGAEDDAHRSRSGALTPRSSSSAFRGPSPSGQFDHSTQARPASRTRALPSPHKDSHSEIVFGSRPSGSTQSSRPASRAKAPSSPLLPHDFRATHTSGEPRPNSRTQQNFPRARELYEGDDEDEADEYQQGEAEFLSRLHLMSDDELQSLLGATIRPRSSPRQPSFSFQRPSLAPVQDAAAHQSLSSPVLGEGAMFAHVPRQKETETVELCRKLSRALAEALSEVTAVTQSFRDQEERFATQMDAMKRRFERRQQATLAVCLQHGITAGTIDRAVARALADMPQVSINVQEQVKTLSQGNWLATPDTPAYTSARRGRIYPRAADVEWDRRPPSAASAAEMSLEPSLPVSLQEAMLDEIDVVSSPGNPVPAHSSLPAKDRTVASQQRVATGKQPSLGTAQTACRSPNGGPSALPTTEISQSESAVSTRSSRRSTTGSSSPVSTRRSSSRAVDGLLPWTHESKDLKATATTQSTLLPAMNVDGSATNTFTAASLGSATLPPGPSLRPSSSNPGFFSTFGWRRGKKEVPPVPAMPESLASPRRDVKILGQADSAPSQAKKDEQSTSLQSAIRIEPLEGDGTSIHPQLDRTSSGRDVISALHEAIGSAPVSPSEQPAHHIDLKALPKPPSVKAIFLATRILGNDSSSLLQNRGRKVSEQVAQKAVDVVKNSIDEGLHIDEPPSRVLGQQSTTRRPSNTHPQLQHSSARPPDSSAHLRASTNAKQKQRPHSMAAQAAAAIVESASGSGTTIASRLSGRQNEARPPSYSRIQPNVTRLPRHLGYGSHQPQAPSLADRTAAQAYASSKGPQEAGGGPGLPVELEAIVPLDGKPPTLALFSQPSRRPTRPPIRSGGSDESSGDEFEVYGGKGNLVVPQPVRSSAIGFDDRAVDVFGFVYDATPADVRLLRQARKASTPAPACLTGIRVGVAARGGSDGHSGSECDEADTDTDSVITQTHTEDTSEEASVAVMPATPSRSVTETIDDSPETSPVRLLGIAQGRPSTETSQVSASSGLDAGPTSPGQEREFQLSSEPLKASEGRSNEAMKPGTPKMREPKATSETVRHLLDQLKVMHSQHQEAQKAKWDSFIQQRRAAMTRIANNAAGAQDREKEKVSPTSARGLLADGRISRAEDQYHHGLIGVRLLGDDKAGKEDRKQFLRLCQEGIPLAHRPKIWAECSGANEVAEPGLFQDLLDEHASESNPCLVQIDLDVHRTMPTNIYFGGDGPGIPKLRRVLAAYSWYNPSTGYCQGMNNLAATLLLTHATEEEAFWVLVCIIDKILPEDYYTSHLLVSQADQRVLIDLVRELMPKLSDHLEELGVDLPAVTFAWFLSLYTDCLPVEVSI